jgi:hypothetical protein
VEFRVAVLVLAERRSAIVALLDAVVSVAEPRPVA